MKIIFFIFCIIFPLSSLQASEVWITYGTSFGMASRKDIQRNKHQLDVSSIVDRGKFSYFNRRVLYQTRSTKEENWRFSAISAIQASKVNCKEKIIYLGGMSGETGVIGEALINYKVGNEWFDEDEFERGYRKPESDFQLNFLHYSHEENDRQYESIYNYVCN